MIGLASDAMITITTIKGKHSNTISISFGYCTLDEMLFAVVLLLICTRKVESS